MEREKADEVTNAPLTSMAKAGRDDIRTVRSLLLQRQRGEGSADTDDRHIGRFSDGGGGLSLIHI